MTLRGVDLMKTKDDNVLDKKIEIKYENESD